MSLFWVILGTIFQIFLSSFVVMVAAFSVGGIVNGRSLSRVQMFILDLSVYLLPILCVVSAGIVIYQYNIGGSTHSYWWYGMPILATVVYLIYAIKLNKT